MSTSALVKQSSRIKTQEVPHIGTGLTSKQDTQEQTYVDNVHCEEYFPLQKPKPAQNLS